MQQIKCDQFIKWAENGRKKKKKKEGKVSRKEKKSKCDSRE